MTSALQTSESEIDVTLQDNEKPTAMLVSANTVTGFSVSDILLSDAPGGRATWVTFPYAAGAPEIMRSLDARWDKMASAWSLPKGQLDAARGRFPRIAELVRVQQSIDAASGRQAPAALVIPNIRSAGLALPLAVAGDDWIKVASTKTSPEGNAMRAIGCASRRVAMTLTWFAQDEETAVAARDALERIREAAAIEADRVKDRQAEQDAIAKIERDRLGLLRVSVAAVFGKRHFNDDALDALAEIAAAWPTARFVTTDSRLLDGRGRPSVTVTTPSGRRVDLTSYVKTTETKVSRRVDIVEVKAPTFPEGSGFTVRVVTTTNGKAWSRDLDPLPVPKPAALTQAVVPDACVRLEVTPDFAARARSLSDRKGMTLNELLTAAMNAMEPGEPASGVIVTP